MHAEFGKWIDKANQLLASLGQVKQFEELDAAIDLANHVLTLLTDEAKAPAEVIVNERGLALPNAERQDSWFRPHPWMEIGKSTFELFDGSFSPIQAKLYWLQKQSVAFISGAVHFTPNWEDHEYTRTGSYKVGLDFFLSPDGETLTIALSNRGKVRVLALEGRLTNTQLEIFEKWAGLAKIVDPATLHSVVWDSFRLQPVNAKFYLGIADAFDRLSSDLITQGRNPESSKMFASRLLGRLIFVWFLRKMGLVASNLPYFEVVEADELYYHAFLERLFFQTLNLPVGDRRPLDGILDIQTPYLNGGLFAPRGDDWVGDRGLRFPPEFFKGLYAHFDDFNFTTDESTPEYEQVAIDPEMLGRVFESLLASQVDESGTQARKAKGTFYTPREVVAYMCKESVRAYLSESLGDDLRADSAISKLLDTADHEWAISGTNSKKDIPQDLQLKLVGALRAIKSIDPACGSGAFPLGLLQLLSKLHLRLDSRLDEYKLKLAILQENIFGVDIEPMAIEISKLRSWLSLVIEERGRPSVEPLPNLEFNFVCADSLTKLKSSNLFSDTGLQPKLGELRSKYFKTSNRDEKSEIQRNYLKIITPDLFDDALDERGGQIKSFNPFDPEQVASFFDEEYMFGIGDQFDLVIGNPPYVKKEHLSSEVISRLNENYFEVNARGKTQRSWSDDLYVHFIFRAFELSKERGVISFITNDSFIGLTSKERVRNLLLDNELVELVTCPPETFDATIYTAIFLAIKKRDDTTSYIGRRFDYPSFTVETLGRVSKAFVRRLPNSRLVTSQDGLVARLLTGSRMGEHLDIKDTGIHSGNCRSKIFFELPTGVSSSKLLQGRQIVRWAVNWNASGAQYRYCDPDYVPQQVPGIGRGGKPSTKNEYWGFVGDKMNHHRAERILIRQTSDNVFAALHQEAVDGQFYTDNTLFSAFPKGDTDLRYVLALLNSKVLSYVYRYLSAEEGKALAQVKTGLLEQLPYVFDPFRAPVLVGLVERLVEARRNDPMADTSSTEQELDLEVAAIYGLSEAERKRVGL